MTTVTGKPGFDFSLEDLAYWVVKRRDGTVCRYVVALKGETSTALVKPNGSVDLTPVYSSSSVSKGNYSKFCTHDPAKEPVFEADGVRLFIADASGARKEASKFDFVLDSGNALNLAYFGESPILEGDEKLVKALTKYVDLVSTTKTRVLKIDWDDREAPFLSPAFWPAIAKMLKGKVLANCQGGHGRSGTTLVCLMMALNPEYGAKDAILHLRAVHCPRAIESKVQHKYINEVATFLGRKADAMELHGINSYREEFLKLTHASSKPYQDRLRA